MSTNKNNLHRVKALGMSGKVHSGYLRKDETLPQARLRILVEAGDVAGATLLSTRRAAYRKANVARTAGKRSIEPTVSPRATKRAAQREANRTSE